MRPTSAAAMSTLSRAPITGRRGRLAIVVLAALLATLLPAMAPASFVPAAQASAQCDVLIQPTSGDDSGTLGAQLSTAVNAAHGNCPEGATITLGVTDNNFQYQLLAPLVWSTDETLALIGAEDDTRAELYTVEDARMLTVSPAGPSPSDISLTNLAFIRGGLQPGGGSSLNVPQGGAVWSGGDSAILATNCYFLGNKADDQGGAIWAGLGRVTAVDSVFQENSGGGWGAGAIAALTVEARGSDFIQNSAGDGGALIALGGGSLDVSTSATGRPTRFLNNVAWYGGGAIFAPELGSPATINDAVFQANAAGNFAAPQGYDIGGAIQILGGAKTTITGTSFTDDSAAFAGGVIYSAAELELSDDTFSGHSSGSAGGVVYADDTLSVMRSSFSASTSEGYGGAIYADGSLSVSHATFTDDTSAWRGGAIFATANASLTVDHSRFHRNQTMGSLTNPDQNKAGAGGAIYAEGSLTVTDDTFLDNLASGEEQFARGGAITGSGVMDIASSYFEGNIADGGTAATDGGAVMAQMTADLTIENSVFVGNTVKSAVTNYGQVAGGAVSSEQGGDIVDSLFQDNTALSHDDSAWSSGGAVFMWHAGTIDGSTFIGNQARGGYSAGGAVLFYRESHDITDSLFQDNTATSDFGAEGGAVQATEGDLTVSDSRFIGNSARSASEWTGGGALTVYSGLLDVDTSTFRNNWTEGQWTPRGGAVMNYGTVSGVTAQDSVFDGNASDEGGAIYTHGPGTIADSYFTANEAQRGAVLGTNNSSGPGGDVTVTNSTMWGNTASLAGSTVYAVSTTGMVSLVGVSIDDSTTDDTSLVSVDTGATVRLLGTLLSKDGSTANTCDGAGTVDDSGGNLVTGACGPITGSDPSSGQSAVVNDDSIGLTAPAINTTYPTNSGALPTMALEPTSVAFNRFTVDCPATDMRGVSRPQGVACDAGSYEASGIASVSASGTTSGQVGSTFAGATFTATGFGSSSYSWDDSGTAIPGLTLASDGHLTGQPTAAGTYAFTARVRGPVDDSTITRTITISAAPNPGPGPGPSPQVPSAPRQVVATAGDGQAQVTWSVPQSDGGASISSYQVTSTPDGRQCLASAPALTCAVTGLSNGTSYTFTVRAMNRVGWGPVSTPSAAVIPLAAPSAPTSVRASSQPRSALVTWSPPRTGPSPTGYVARWRLEGGAWTTGNVVAARSYTISELRNGRRYEVQVAGDFSGTLGPWSASALVTPLSTPSKVKDLVAKVKGTAVTLTWSPPVSLGGTPVTGYRVWIKRAGGDWRQLKPTTEVPRYTVGDLRKGDYWFKVAARNAVGWGPAVATDQKVRVL